MTAVSTRNLRVTLDDDLYFRDHISHNCLAWYYYIHDFRRIRRYLSLPVDKAIATALVASILDYCNTFLNIILKEITKLQLCSELHSKGCD